MPSFSVAMLSDLMLIAAKGRRSGECLGLWVYEGKNEGEVPQAKAKAKADAIL